MPYSSFTSVVYITNYTIPPVLSIIHPFPLPNLLVTYALYTYVYHSRRCKSTTHHRFRAKPGRPGPAYEQTEWQTDGRILAPLSGADNDNDKSSSENAVRVRRLKRRRWSASGRPVKTAMRCRRLKRRTSLPAQTLTQTPRSEWRHFRYPHAVVFSLSFFSAQFPQFIVVFMAP